MIISVRRWKEWIKFFVLFVLFTTLLYLVMSFLMPLLQPDDEYKEPLGGAVKVIVMDLEIPKQEITFSREVWERVKLFYQQGE
ncbi:DUF4227 family protein [Risungbinella massiliensis]|uniref:DUF4227 family protein n=1 Tax=Risungbinella massiliensis TaxID=1329796 RepID=UPI00069975B3|nr:DUF4227 family protein [Risungbinella massiliensis]